MLYFQTFASIWYIRIYRSPCYISNCPDFSIPYIYTHHSDQFCTLLLASYYHYKFQLLFVSRSFSASLVTFPWALFSYSYFSISILYRHFLFMVILTSYIPFYKYLQTSWSQIFFITRWMPTSVLHHFSHLLHRFKYFST